TDPQPNIHRRLIGALLTLAMELLDRQWRRQQRSSMSINQKITRTMWIRRVFSCSKDFSSSQEATKVTRSKRNRCRAVELYILIQLRTTDPRANFSHQQAGLLKLQTPPRGNKRPLQI